MPGVNISVSAQIQGDYTAEAGIAAEDSHVYLSPAIAFLTGAGVDQADTLYSQEVFLGPSGTETLDLLTGLTDALGAPVVFARVKAFCFVSAPTNIAGVTFAGGASDPWVGPLAGTTPTLTVNAGGLSLEVAPDAVGWVVNSGACNLKLTNLSSVNGASGQLLILGSAE